MALITEFDHPEHNWVWTKMELRWINDKLAAAQAREKALRAMTGEFLSQLMDVAVANGANSVSMPDEYVEAASFLAQPTDDSALKAALAAERESERERCAKLCIDLRRANYSGETGDWIDGTEDCAKAIRALGDE